MLKLQRKAGIILSSVLSATCMLDIVWSLRSSYRTDNLKKPKPQTAMITCWSSITFSQDFVPSYAHMQVNTVNLNYVINLNSMQLFFFFNFTAHYSPCTHQYKWSNNFTCTRGSGLWFSTNKHPCYQSTNKLKQIFLLLTHKVGFWSTVRTGCCLRIRAPWAPQGLPTAPAKEQGRLGGSPSSRFQALPWGWGKVRLGPQSTGQE